MPLVAPWATPDDVKKGTGVLYVEGMDGATDAELYITRGYGFDLAKVLEEDVPASLPDSAQLRETLADNTARLAIHLSAVVSAWHLANKYREVIGASRLHAAADELEQYLRVLYYEHAAVAARKKPLPWGRLALAGLAVLGGYGAVRLYTYYRGRAHAHG